ncbi:MULTISPECIES: LemA family protein [Fervidobacterium]|uniref:LemA family protein n=1 Tax=Fervidobacterium nodosum (strain ATCC 35602 / DSM 5306 / Rt17-B1) TaxID=381764 RepID=A7HNM2_FERNB|nr:MULTISPECIES: LemA family protein [Fervidobacterium]ABS61505.1 LemA family protein [Fervidobacterium nodosum Rt17-B1]KAF2961943.1 LemA family protein [Fervidobacterium sp. 2310opik-2]PHJ12968.1 LemA family protein [Fervidobacterium sp. SC_NGM5_G05]HOJ94455.1 LemA family protein [Fervidobacterium nodosum]
MKKGVLVILGIVVVILIIVFWIIGAYNKMVALEQNVNEKYSQIQNQLQRRLDLIPNLVETVKGYAAQEREIFEAIANARAKLAGAQTPQEQATADAELSNVLSRLLVIVENYPTLKSDANFRQLMDELAGTENRIAVARKDYNEAVKEYNTLIKKFPYFLIAGSRFTEKQYFEAKPGAENAPEVKF